MSKVKKLIFPFLSMVVWGPKLFEPFNHVDWPRDMTDVYMKISKYGWYCLL